MEQRSAKVLRVRIALAPSSYAPDVGGVEELSARLARRLLNMGDQVEVWTIRHPLELPEREEIDGVSVRRFAMPMPRLSGHALARFPRDATVAFAAVHAAAAQLRPDVIHVQCFSTNGLYATWVAKRRQVPLVVTLQGETMMDDADIYDHSLTLRTSLRWGLRRAAAVTACSAFVLADAERRFGLSPGDGEVIPNGVELNEAAEAAAFELPFDRFVLGLGRVVHKKGFDLLLDAFACIAADHPNLGLVIAGDGSARDKLIGAAARLGLGGRVVLPGTLSRAQVAWAMGSATAFVLPSRIEPFGIVVLEALRAGCPTIVSTLGGTTEIVRDGVETIVVDPRDTAALAMALGTLVSDAQLAARLGGAGRERVTEFDWAAITGRYRAIYDRVAR